MTIQYKTMKYDECFEQVNEMLSAHHNEASNYQDLVLNPDFEMYKQANKKGLFRIYCCLDDNQIVGYLTYLIFTHIHYKHKLIANQDIYYLKPDYRKGFIAVKLFKFAEKHLKSLGISYVQYSTNTKQDRSKLFEFLGCELTEKTFYKSL